MSEIVLQSKLKRLELLMNKSYFSSTIGDSMEIVKVKKEIIKLENKLLKSGEESK